MENTSSAGWRQAVFFGHMMGCPQGVWLSGAFLLDFCQRKLTFTICSAELKGKKEAV